MFLNKLSFSDMYLNFHFEFLLFCFYRALADTDSDGKMNIDEFSIACKLITLKLRGVELPKTLPPTLIASLSAVGGTPTRTPTSGMSPLDPIAGLTRPPIPPQPLISAQHVLPPQSNITTQPMIAKPMIPPQPVLAQQDILSMAGMQMPPLIPTQPLIPGATQSLIGNSIPPMIPQQPIIPMQPLISTGGVPLDNLTGTSIGVIKPLIEPQKLISPTTDMVILPPGHTPPHSGTPSRSMSLSERAPSIESP